MRKKLKKIVSLLLCFILILPISAFALQSTDDYSEHWAGGQIKSFLDKGFVTVDKDGNFKPNDPVTRGDFAAIANKAFIFTEKDENNFKDVKSNESYYNDILVAKKAGYLVGLPDGTVMPKGYMNRQEYAVIISRLLKLDTTKYISEANNFKDTAAIPDWSKGAVGAVAKAGYMQGEPENVFNPKGFITRGQAVAVLERCYLDNVKVAYNEPGTYSANIVEGNVAINSPDVVLENTTITGNLIIGEGVGEGNVRLRNVIVKGDTIVKGGGLNSIIIENSQIKNIIIIKENNKVRILAVGSTTVDSVDMQSGGKLEEQGMTGTGFGYVTIAENIDPNELITLIGNFDSVQIQADGINLDVASGNVANLVVAETALNAQISLGTGTSVTNMIVDSAAVVTGTGTIGTAQVNVQGSTITAPTTTTNTTAGVTVATSLPTTTPTTTPTPTPTPTPAAPPSGGSSGGGGGGGSHDNDTNINVSAITVTGTGNVTTITTDNGTLQMLAAVTPANATNKTVTWSVTNGTGEATISNTGLLKAVADGIVTVRATAKDGSGKFGTKVITISNQLPTLLYTSSTVVKGAVNPAIVVTLVNDTFTPDGISNIPSSWAGSIGTTSLQGSSITRDSATQMTFYLTGTAGTGALTLKANAAALTSGVESNTISVIVLEPSDLKGTIEPAGSLNGIVFEEPTINNREITYNGRIAYYTSDVPISGNWVGVKITAPADVMPDENAVLYVNGRNINLNENPGWANIIEEGDGDNYFHLYQRVTDISRVYNIVIKWNTDLTEAYSVNFAPTAILEHEHGKIEQVPVIGGGENATATISNRDIKFEGEIPYYIATESNGLLKSGNWVGVKITAPAGVMPDENAVLTAHGISCNRNGEPGWENIWMEGDGDNYFHLYQRVRNTAYVYEVVIKWNNNYTEKYSIIIPPSTILEFSELELVKLGVMIGDAQSGYDNAYDYGNIYQGEIDRLGEVIGAAEEVYGEVGVTQSEIYAAQIELAAAIDAFFDAYPTEIIASPALDETVANAVYEESDPLIITLDITNGIGDFDSGLEDYITLGGALSGMSINSVTFEGETATRAILELTGTVGDSIGDGYIRIAEGGVYGHNHGFIVSRGMLERAQAINGGENAAVTINGHGIKFDGEIAYYIADESNGLPISGSWVGVKITAPEGVMPDENAVLTVHGINCNMNGEPGWANIIEDGDGDNYFHLYQRVRDTAYVYEVVIKWNNDLTETYLIIIPGTATLEVFRTDLENGIIGAQFNYDNAATYGDIGEEAVEALGTEIVTAQAVCDEAVDAKTGDIQDTMQQGVYDAQDSLTAAMDAFFDAYNTKIVATASSTLDGTVAGAVYDSENPLILSLSIENGIGDFVTENVDYITLGGDLSGMTINSVTFEGDTATVAVLELTGPIGDSIENGTITIAAGGVNGHSHGFEAVWAAD